MRTPASTALFRTSIATLLLLLSSGACRAADEAADEVADAAAPAAEGEPATDIYSRATRVDDASKAPYWDIYLSGYAHHDRSTYSDAQIRKLNETTWGGGMGRSFRNERGNEESVYAMVIRDSNNRPQWMAGYAYQWKFALKKASGLEVGAGLSGLIIRRHDWYNGRPFPAILPVASIGNRMGQLLMTYVPHLSDRKKKGDILQVMFKLSFR